MTNTRSCRYMPRCGLGRRVGPGGLPALDGIWPLVEPASAGSSQEARPDAHPKRAERAGAPRRPCIVAPMAVIEWLLDSDPAIRWQVMRDLLREPEDVVAAERARVATEGW